MSTLYIVATPIGNLEDITLRAIRILKEADYILCEDTRVTSKLLNRYDIKKSLLSYHKHSKQNKIDEILELLKKEKNLALVSDAGTPGISDPGNELVAEVLKSSLGTKIVPIPGPSAATTLASIAGIEMNSFAFFGFPPHKKGRQTFFKKVLESDVPVIFYESSHRILKSLNQLKDIFTNYKLQIINYQLVIGRELTKQFESVYRGDIGSVLDQLMKDKIKGEFVVVIKKIRI